MRSSLRRATAVALLLLLGMLWPAGGALAADASGPGALSGVAVAADGSVSGVLTVGGVLDGGGDPGSITAHVGSTELQVVTQVVAPDPRGTFIVVDTSTQMGSAGIAAVQKGVAAYLKVIPDDLLVGLISYNATAKVVVPLTADRGAVTAGAGALTTGAGRATYDALAIALTQLGGAGQRGVLLVTAGADSSSAATKDQVVTSIRASKVRTLVVGYRSSAADAGALQELATAGGGAGALATDPAGLADQFTAAGRLTTSQVTWKVRPDDSLYGTQQVVLSGSSGGVAFSAGSSVDLGAAPVVKNAAPAQVAVPDKAVAFGLPLPVILGLVAIAVGLLGVVASLASPALASRGSMRAQEISRAFESRIIDARQSPSAISEGLVAFGDRMMKDRESTSKIVALLERADLPLRAGEWWVLRVVSVIALGAIGGALFSKAALVGILLGGVLGIFAPALVLRRLASRRATAFDTQLPDVLTLLASSLQTGFSLLQSMDAVARDAAQPAAKEFSRTMAETRIGADIDEALARLSTRMGSQNMEITAMAVRIQRQVGGNLAETLRTTATTVRDRQSLARHVKGLSAEGRISAYILFGLPIFVFVFTFNTNYDYIAVLWSSFIGVAMLVYGVISMGIGLVLMRKVIQVEV